MNNSLIRERTVLLAYFCVYNLTDHLIAFDQLAKTGPYPRPYSQGAAPKTALSVRPIYRKRDKKTLNRMLFIG